MYRPAAMKLLVVVCAVVALSVAGSAGAAKSSCKLLVPGTSLACVSVGMTQAQVHSVAGAPRSTSKVTGCCGQILSFVYPHFTVSFMGGHVRWVYSTSRVYRTASGVGIGSTKAQLLAGVRGARCGVFGLAKTFCIAGKALDDPKQTLFALRNGRVVLERLGFQPE
jgi:hypothetical protein